ncbi:MAG TPA: YbdD/YjiX family protein [Pseudonocardia sp.]|jgi:uncharacterized short protein YbdD (DUF466 family)|nr:YbdD/YjiX family protein [Pseudonocardia sp.]
MIAALRRAGSGVRWYLRELTGESAYDHYLDRHHREHPDAVPLTRREFEKRRTDHAEANPQARCC